MNTTTRSCDITFPASTFLPWCVYRSWGRYHHGRDARLFCLEEGEASAIEVIDPVSCFHVLICQGDKKLIEDWVNREYAGKLDEHVFKLETDGKACCFTHNPKRHCLIWVCIPPREDAACVFSIMAHEAVHAAHAMMNGMGMKPDFANEEWVAYVVQWLLNCFAQTIGYPIDTNEVVA